MNLKLFIDTSSDMTTAALVDGESVLIEKSNFSNRSHSEELFLVLNDIFKKINVSFNDLREVIYIAGPGSFTGLRIAYSAVSALKLALNVKVFGISSLKAVLANLNGAFKKFSIIESTSNDVFAYMLDEENKVVMDEKLISLSNLISKISSFSNVKVFGSGVFKHLELLEKNNIHISKDKNLNYINVKGMLSVYNRGDFVDKINYLKDTYAKKGGKL